MVIAIDGPGGVGKSTVTRCLATVLGVEFLDTGAIYRAATVAALRSGVDLDDETAVLAAVKSHEMAYEDGVILLDGESVAEATRSPEATFAVTQVSAYATVREHCVDMQRRWVADRGGEAVVEGRDIGTTVFPDAPVKVFLTADAATRAARRAGDAEAADQNIKEIEADLNRRDHGDSTRKASPLRPADDAVEVDTTNLDIEGVVAAILELVAEARSVARSKLNRPEIEAGLADTPGYRYADEVGDRLFLAGQVPLDAGGDLVGVGDVGAQARRCLDNLALVVTANGFRVEDVRRLTIHVVGEQNELPRAWDAVREWFNGEVPPATLLGASHLGYANQLVEIDADVVRSKQ